MNDISCEMNQYLNVRHKLSVVIVNAFKRSSIHKELIFAPQKVLPSLFSFVLWFVLFLSFFPSLFLSFFACRCIAFIV